MLLEKVYRVADKDVRVAMWLLERSYPEDFSLSPYFRKTQQAFDDEFLKRNAEDFQSHMKGVNNE